MIEYLYTEGKKDAPIKVRLDGRIVGAIKKVSNGYAYFPKGVRTFIPSDVYPTVSQVQRSLNSP